MVTTTAGLLVILGTAVRAPTRYLTDRWLQSTHGTGFPWGTFTVNIVASFVLGLITGFFAVATVSPAAAVLIGTGFCGALSTWSTLGHDTVRLAEGRAWTSGLQHRRLGACRSGRRGLRVRRRRSHRLTAARVAPARRRLDASASTRGLEDTSLRWSRVARRDTMVSP
jgi:CrcB protein